MSQPQTIDEILERYKSGTQEFEMSPEWIIGYDTIEDIAVDTRHDSLSDTKQALADLLLGLPSLQDDPIPNADSSDFSKRYDALVAHENWFKKRIRQEIAEALGVSHGA